ncbi:MAG: hypothetical protein JWP18_2072, partial [Solirubrobacterales bacterium]|nr:hypothetical protein [Solirubrobacterales bacterium]
PAASARAGDADREAALDVLRQATVDGRHTVDEHAERAGLAQRALTHGELAAVTADLPASTSVLLAAAAPGVTARHPGDVEEHRNAFSFARYTGRRAMTARSRFRCTLANVHLDLRDVVVPGPQVDVEIHATLAWVQVVVPEGIEVRMAGDGLLTNREVHLRAMPVPPGAPVVILHVGGFLGSVSVRSRPRRVVRRGR